jgi:hypothetical protein
MKSIFLDYRGREWTITDDAFQQIADLIRANCICQTCESAYTDEIPQVAQNCCLRCFLVSENRHRISFLDEADGHFRFIDPKGEIRLSDIGNTESRISVSETIRYHGFPIPQTIVLEGVAKVLSPWSWQINGDVTRSCVALKYGSSGGGETYISLAYKNGEYVVLSKRKHSHRELLQRARNQIEASKVKEGYYRIGDRRFYSLYDSSVFEVASEIASIEYDISKKVLE